MTCTVFFLGLMCGVIAVSGSDLTCINNTTCINNEVCGDSGCGCPNSHYGANCEFSITNALIIVVICIFPPVSWLAVCCYGVHSKGSSRLWNSRGRGGNTEPEGDVEEDVLEDLSPPSYAQILQYNTAGTFEGVMVFDGPASQDVEPPPSYQEWTRKAARLRKQEIGGGGGGGGIGLVTISDNLPVPSQAVSEDAESEDQC